MALLAGVGSALVISAAGAAQSSQPSGDTIAVIAGDGPPAGPPVPGPATASPLGEPDGVAVDASGNVYIADITNDQIEKVTRPERCRSSPATAISAHRCRAPRSTALSAP